MVKYNIDSIVRQKVDFSSGSEYLPENYDLKDISELNNRLEFQKNQIEKRVTAGDSMANYLQQIKWDYFMTLTTPYSLTLPAARRLSYRFVSVMENNNMKSGMSIEEDKLFWVAEKFECKDGYHLHGLLKTNASTENIINSYQTCTGVNVPQNIQRNK